ncbi:hypothetical protein ACFL67_02160 [candidate division KSB1 bacterium]
MASILEKQVKSLKDRIEKLKHEVQRLEKEDQAGLLSPLERMRLQSLKDERAELITKMKELLM